jgi:hypothetical protein
MTRNVLGTQSRKKGYGPLSAPGAVEKGSYPFSRQAYARARLGAGMAAGSGADQLVCGARFSTSQPYSKPE